MPRVKCFNTPEQELIRQGKVSDYAELGRIGHVSRARITQIMNLLNLAPDIQEAILDLPRVTEGKDPVAERQVRIAADTKEWCQQRQWVLNLKTKHLSTNNIHAAYR